MNNPENLPDDYYQPSGYSQIRSISTLSGDSFELKPSNYHWSAIVDLAPLHPQAID